MQNPEEPHMTNAHITLATLLSLFLLSGCFSPVGPDPQVDEEIDPPVPTVKIYVDGVGGDDDTGDGSQALPFASVHSALSAIPEGEVGEIRVAGGMYESSATIFADVPEAIIKGGYDPSDGWSRDVTNNPTVVQNTTSPVFRLEADTTLDGMTIRTYPEGGTAQSAWSAIQVQSGSDTVSSLSNVRIHVSSTNSPHFGVRVFTGATGSMGIKDSIIYAGGTNQSGAVGGVRLEGADSYAMTIEDSEIVLQSVGGTGDPSPLYGAYLARGELTITDSTIRTDGSIIATDTVYGVLTKSVNPTLVIDRTLIDIETDSDITKAMSPLSVFAGSARITNSIVKLTVSGTNYIRGFTGGSGAALSELYNNTIVVRTDTDQSPFGVFINPSQDNVSMRNNIVIVQNSGSATTFAISGPSDASVLVETNVFYNDGAATIDGDYTTGNTVYQTIGSFAFADYTGADTDPSNDFQLSAESPTLLRAGGESLSGVGVTADYGGTARTTGFSIGAFEYEE